MDSYERLSRKILSSFYKDNKHIIAIEEVNRDQAEDWCSEYAERDWRRVHNCFAFREEEDAMFFKLRPSIP